MTQDLTTLLKYLRGSDFTERHWREIFNLLDMEYKKPDTLLVKDFLNVALHIQKQIKPLQVRTHLRYCAAYIVEMDLLQKKTDNLRIFRDKISIIFK